MSALVEGFCGGGGSGKDIVNGYLGTYYAESENIEPSTFVEFVNNTEFIIDKQNKSLLGIVPGTQHVKALMIESNKVLLLRGGSYYTSNVNENLGANVITFTESNELQISDMILVDSIGRSSVYHSSLDAVVVGENVLITIVTEYAGGSRTYYSEIKAILTDLAGNKITETLLGTGKATNSYSDPGVKIGHLGNEKFIVMSRSSASNTIACLIEVKNNTINTLYSDFGSNEISCSSQPVGLTVLNEREVFFIYSKNGYLYGTIVEVINNSISLKSDYLLAQFEVSGLKIDSVKMGEKVLIAIAYANYSSGSSYTHALHLMCVNMVDYDKKILHLSVPIDVYSVSVYEGQLGHVNITKMQNDEVCVAMLGKNIVLCPVIVRGNTIIVGEPQHDSTSIYHNNSTYPYTVCAMEIGKLIATAGSSMNVYNIQSHIKVKKSVSYIHGVSKTKLSPSMRGDVFYM